MLYPWLQPAWQQFVSMLQRQRLPHALLINGLAGIGKQQFADEMAATLLCLDVGADGLACGKCHSCLILKATTHPDHTVVQPEEAGKQIKIDQIRDLKAKQSLTTNIAPYKTVIINPADAMTTSAANSLLKLLEEPQQNTVLILLSAAAEKLPITIRSRCQTLTINTPETQAAIDWLEQQAPYSDWSKLLELTSGAPLAALTLSESDTGWIEQIDADFRQLVHGQGNPVALAAGWQNLELPRVFHHLQRRVQQRLRQAIIQSETDAQAAGITSEWQIADCIMNTLKLISSQNNFNKTLLIEDFMVSIKQIAAVAKHH